MKLAGPARAVVYDAAERFVDAALRRDDALFAPGRPIWTKDGLEDLRDRFALHPDLSSDSFLAKFKRQLSGASDETMQLAAEMLYVHFLIALMAGDAKRAVIRPVISWMHAPPVIPRDLDVALDAGIAKPGTAFHTRRPFQLAWFTCAKIR